LLSKGDGTDTIQLATLTQDRLLAAHPGRFSQ
jgi:hypothetical protein